MTRLSAAGLFGAVALAACSVAPEPAPSPTTNIMTDAEAEALYNARFAALTDRTSRTGLSLYDPLVPIDGAPNWRPLPHTNPGSSAIPDEARRALHDYAMKNRSDALLVWLDGRIEMASYFGDTTHATLLNAKSFAKPLSVIAVGRAIAEGHIDSLDQPVAAFIKEWRGTPKEKIRVRDLLGMRSGLLAQGQAPDANNILNRVYLHPFHDDILIKEYPLVHEPGSRYDYSNANADLIAPLLERATGIAYENWLANQVLKPLGARGGEIWMNRLDGTPHSGCCVLLPAEVHMRTAILVLQDGVWEGRRLLPTGFVTQMKTSSAQNSHAGLGVYLGNPYLERRGFINPDLPFGKVFHSEPYLADDLILFDGNSNQVAYIVPSKKLIVLRLGRWPPKDPEWDNAFLPNTVLRSLAR